MKNRKTKEAIKVLMRVYPNDESKVVEVLSDVQAVVKAAEGERFREMVKALFHWQVIERYCKVFCSKIRTQEHCACICTVVQ